MYPKSKGNLPSVIILRAILEFYCSLLPCMFFSIYLEKSVWMAAQIHGFRDVIFPFFFSSLLFSFPLSLQRHKRSPFGTNLSIRLCFYNSKCFHCLIRFLSFFLHAEIFNKNAPCKCYRTCLSGMNMNKFPILSYK